MAAMDPTPRVSVDPDLCIGTGECWRIAPDAFALDPARGVSVPREGAARADRGLLAEAELGCPTRAITVREAER